MAERRENANAEEEDDDDEEGGVKEEGKELGREFKQGQVKENKRSSW